ncbi:MAG: DNA primase family protein [Bacilli bacterium]
MKIITLRKEKRPVAVIRSSTPRTHYETDLGNAERLVARHGQDIRHVPEVRKWLVWNGSRWVWDHLGEVIRLAEGTVREIYAEATKYDDPDTRKGIARWAKASESKPRLEYMMNLTSTQTGIPVSLEDLDKDAYVLNVLNGVIDLKAGAISPNKREDLLTKLAPVHYDPSASCPTWLRFLGRIFADNNDVIRFVQRAVGYSMTGDVSEQVLFIAHGNGNNGKTVFAKTIQALLGDGDYSSTMAPGLLIENPGTTHPTGLADLIRKRFVVASEIDSDQRLREALVKQLTGGDRVKARYMHRDFFEFDPECKIWMLVNYLPLIRGRDDGIWRRIIVIPFPVKIDKSERDLHFLDMLIAELPGILNWALEGLKDWREHGLSVPAQIQDAIESYRTGMDSVKLFIGECCLFGAKMKVKVGDLYEAYVSWCDDVGRTALSKRTFGERVALMYKQGHSGKNRYWFGVGLRADREE